MKPKHIEINDWKKWKELGEEHGFNPYKTVDWCIDMGGGNSINVEYYGDPPEEEE